VYFGAFGANLQFGTTGAEGRVTAKTKVDPLLRRRLRRKRAEALATLLAELLGRAA